MKEDDKTYWQQLQNSYNLSSGQFDKQVLFLASGALSISFAFIKDIVNLDQAENKEFLIGSWKLFCLVILLNIISHYFSYKAINYRIENLKATDDKFSKLIDYCTQSLNILMLLGLVVGLYLLFKFIEINI